MSQAAPRKRVYKKVHRSTKKSNTNISMLSILLNSFKKIAILKKLIRLKIKNTDFSLKKINMKIIVLMIMVTQNFRKAVFSKQKLMKVKG